MADAEALFEFATQALSDTDPRKLQTTWASYLNHHLPIVATDTGLQSALKAISNTFRSFEDCAVKFETSLLESVTELTERRNLQAETFSNIKPFGQIFFLKHLHWPFPAPHIITRISNLSHSDPKDVKQWFGYIRRTLGYSKIRSELCDGDKDLLKSSLRKVLTCKGSSVDVPSKIMDAILHLEGQAKQLLGDYAELPIFDAVYSSIFSSDSERPIGKDNLSSKSNSRICKSELPHASDLTRLRAYPLRKLPKSHSESLCVDGMQSESLRASTLSKSTACQNSDSIEHRGNSCCKKTATGSNAQQPYSPRDVSLTSSSRKRKVSESFSEYNPHPVKHSRPASGVVEPPATAAAYHLAQDPCNIFQPSYDPPNPHSNLFDPSTFENILPTQELTDGPFHIQVAESQSVGVDFGYWWTDPAVMPTYPEIKVSAPSLDFGNDDLLASLFTPDECFNAHIPQSFWRDDPLGSTHSSLVTY